MAKRVIIIGAGGHGKVIADIIERSGESVAGYLDDRNPEDFPGFPVIGRVTDALKFAIDHEFIAAIGHNARRQQLMRSLRCDWYTAIHPSAVIAPDAVIGKGSAVMANAVINPGCRIGDGVIINTAATVDHDCILADFVHLSPGAHLAGEVRVGVRTWIGIGAGVIQCVTVCVDCVVGAGAVVIRDIEQAGTYIGVPAKLLEKEIGRMLKTTGGETGR